MKNRLIDANELDVDYVKASTATNRFRLYISKEQVENAPTVDAIPIEWIKKYLKPFYEHYNALSPESQETCGAGWVIDVLETMMRDWEKENE